MPIGILCAFAAYALFSSADAMVKHMAGAIPVYETAFFMSVFACIPLWFARPKGERWRDMLKMKRPILVMVRLVSGVVAGYLGIYAFRTLPLAEAYALIFLIPFFVTLFSATLLGEDVGWRRWTATMAGLAGVLLVVRPGFRELLPGHFAATGVAFAGAATMITLRVLGRTEQRVVLIGSVMAGAILINGLVMLPVFVMPPRDLWPWLIASGMFAGLGQAFLITATRLTPASQVAPTQYSQIIWAVVLGAIFFAELPDAVAFVGMAVVAVSGLYTFVREEARVGWSRRTPLLRNRV